MLVINIRPVCKLLNMQVLQNADLCGEITICEGKLRIRKKADLEYFNVLPRRSPEETEGNL